MKGAFRTVDITPPVGIDMGGNCREDLVSRGVHDPLCADIIILGNCSMQFAFIDLDWCEAQLDTIRKIKNKIALKTGLQYEHICINMSHTHSSPDMFGCFNVNGLPDITIKYIEETADKLAAAAADAMLGMEDIMIGAGKGYEDRLNFNRRIFFKDGSLHMNWEILENPMISQNELDKPEGPIDTDLFVVKFCSRDGDLKAILVNFTLHAAILVMEDMLFSKDFVWGMEKKLKEEYGQDVLVYFANGAEGNINHIDMWNREQKRSWTEAERVGTLLAENVIKLLGEITVKDQDTLAAKFEKLDMPVRKIPEEQIVAAKTLWKNCKGVIPGLVDGVPDEWYAWSVINLAENQNRTRELELQAVRIGDIIIATLPGEIFVEFGLKLKKASPFENTLLFGLANQSIGYIPTEQAFANGGYEPKTCETSVLVPEAGDIIVDKLFDMIRGL